MVAQMIWIALDSLWHFILSSASIATLVGAGAVLIAIFEPKQLDAITDLRKWAIVVAVLAFSYTSIAGKFYNDGLGVKQQQWDDALSREIENGDAARSDAERTVGPVSSDRGVFRGDPFNLDRGKPASGK